MKEYSDISSKSELIDEHLEEQLKTVFYMLTKEVYLISIVDEKNLKCLEMIRFLKAIAGIHTNIHLEFYAKGEDRVLEDKLHCIDMLPVVGIFNNQKAYTGISFFGIPGGRELNSFVMAIYNVAGEGQRLDKKVMKRILKLKKKYQVNVFVTLACQYCADTVIAFQKIASLSKNVEAAMVDVSLFPELSEKYQLERVPVAFINNSSKVVGGKSIEEVLSILEKC